MRSLIRCILKSPINPMQLYFLCLGVFQSSFPANNVRFLTRLNSLPAQAGIFTSGKTRVRRPHTQFTGVACSLPVKTSKYNCFYAASTSHRIHAIARNIAQKLRVTSPAGCRLTYLQFASEFTRGIIADCLQLKVILCAMACNFACDCVSIFACICSYFWLHLAGIFFCNFSVLACKLRVILPANCM